MLDKIKSVIGDLAASAFALVYKLPRSVRLLIRDMLEGVAAALAAIPFVIPETADDAKKLAIAIFVAVSAALVAVTRRWVWQRVLDKIGGVEVEIPQDIPVDTDSVPEDDK